MHQSAEGASGLRGGLTRVGLASLMTVVGVNVWTGSPLFALWIGSRVQGTGPPKMSAFVVFALVLAATSVVLVKVLSALGQAYDRMTGQAPTVRAHAPWLRSMSGERPQYPGEKPTLTMLERLLVVMVLVVFLAFEVWFFFFSPSPIDQRSGRSALPDPPAVRV